MSGVTPFRPTTSKPDQAIAVRIDAVKLYSKNTLRAFVDFTLLDLGMSIKGATIHEKEGNRWASMPAKSYTDGQGTHYSPVIEFTSRENRDRLSDAVIAAYDQFNGGGER